MKPASTLAAAALVAALPFSASAFAVGVDAQDNSVRTGNGAFVIDLMVGDKVNIDVDPTDIWSAGAAARWTSNAGGVTDGTTRSFSGQTFVVGTLIGQIGGGSFFEVGTTESFMASVAGTLQLFQWDGPNSSDNSGSILAEVSVTPAAAIPLPASLGFLAAGLAGFGLLRRKKT